MQVGSTGAGVNIEQGVTTRVSLKKGLKKMASISLNGRPLRNPIVSRMVIDDFLNRDGHSWHVRVNHRCRLPVGSGYGTSGAGAASLSLALNDALGNPFSRNGALAIAHIAEVKAKTGLGTVASVSRGGLAVRLKPGAPGVGEVRRLPLRTSQRVVSGSFGPILTKRVLSSRTLRTRVNFCSGRLVASLLKRPDGQNFVRLSRTFAECLGIISLRLRRFLDLADMRGRLGSMMMIGDGAFCLVSSDLVPVIVGLMRLAGLSPVVSRIYAKGAHLI